MYEPGLKFSFESFKKKNFLSFIAIRFGLIALCCADESTKDDTVLSVVCLYSLLYVYLHCWLAGVVLWLSGPGSGHIMA